MPDEPEPYLVRLTTRLLEGVERLPAEQRARNVHYLLSAQNPDGGFSGREGGSDLYYTGFALRSLAVLQALNPEVCGNAAHFLRTKMTGTAGVVDFFSLVVSCYLVPLGGGPDVLADAPPDWRDRVAATLETFRGPDGGYGKTPAALYGSTYTSFLVTLCLQLLGRPSPDPDKLAAFVRSRRRSDGGYVEISAMKRSGTNPTAAGVGVLQILGALDEGAKAETATFLAALVSPFEGGLRANDRIPAADLLSTFTGGWTLDQLGHADKLDWEAVQRYAEECERPIGGFRGGLWDEHTDVEYTFYGLGTLALAALRLGGEGRSID
ncbi:prenyltransferase/squalene oxidase repeat-containing protein [Gemmata sp. JC717]|uniref:prenyltransferase/squalene oxidase repeat-containing protein n=1 Tax=Gemmata algarum TaxID=2975278 RepID=UPI0021BAC512|nr:prenyltransferase/squalene oxidase repeat-containing protein [Gemmata algarum]MDY3555184.1 prenyltransferase/squalene oxidase repeat-containing protein [Gemmata algarum]